MEGSGLSKGPTVHVHTNGAYLQCAAVRELRILSDIVIRSTRECLPVPYVPRDFLIAAG